MARAWFEGFLDALPYGIVLILAGLVVLCLRSSGMTFQNYLDLIRVIIWPLISLVGLLFFRKVFTYLFFSINEFNFFGARGRLKNVQQVIREKADALWKLEKQQTQEEEDRAKLQSELNELRDTNTQQGSRNERLYELALKFADNNDKLEKENANLKEQVNALLSQVSAVQSQTLQTPILSDKPDIGTGDQIIDLTPQQPQNE